MPAYNAAKYLREAIDSILAQTFTDFEFIIINDGSTDATRQIIQSYDDPRIIYLENEHNSGICVTLNRGLDAARGRYIARMDSDDISLPERFARQVAYMDTHPDIGVLGTLVERISNDGSTIDYPPSENNPYKCKASLLFATCVAHPAVMMRTSILKDNNLYYDDYFRGMEDYHLWWRLSHYTMISNIQEVLLKYRLHQNQITQISINEDFIKRHGQFIQLRLLDFSNEFTVDDVNSFSRYMFMPQSFDDESLDIFVRSLSSVVNSLKNDNRYKQAQKLVAGKAISYAYDMSARNLKKSSIHYMIQAYRLSCMSFIWLLKRIYHIIF